MAASALIPLPTCFFFPHPQITFSLGGCNTFMCHLLNPAPLNIRLVLFLFGNFVINKFLGMSLSFMAHGKE